MCIVVNKDYPHQPDGSVRFKLMRLHKDGSVGGLNHRADGNWATETAQPEGHVVGSVRAATLRDSPDTDGIHVCSTEEEFAGVHESYREGCWSCKFAKVKVECRGFLAGGKFILRDGDTSVQNETWKEVTILEISEVPNR